MKKSLLYITAFCLGGACLAIGPVAAQHRPPAPDFAAAATELGVSEGALVGCLGERPEPGQRPPRPDPEAIADCLNEGGANVSTDAVDAALQSIAPPRPRN